MTGWQEKSMPLIKIIKCHKHNLDQHNSNYIEISICSRIFQSFGFVPLKLFFSIRHNFFFQIELNDAANMFEFDGQIFR